MRPLSANPGNAAAPAPRQLDALVRRTDLQRPDALDALASRAGLRCESLAAVTLVGAAPAERPAVLAALRTHAPEVPTYAGPTSLSLAVPVEACDPLVRALHGALIG